MNKRIVLLGLAIIGVLFVLTSTTYSLFYRKEKLANTESYTTGNLSIVLDNSGGLGNALSLSSAYPMSDSDGMNTTPYSFRITNNGNLDYQFDLSLTGSGTLSYSYIKIMVGDNDPVTLTGNTMTIASGINLKAGRSMIANVRVWLDLNTPNSEIGKSYTASLNASGLAVTNTPLDDSGANYPELVKGMIPVMYDTTNSTWVKADTSSKTGTYRWYDYDNKMWANAVLVSSTNRSTYMSASAGTAIPESDILAYYVWIPRYKYKVWNISKSLNTDSYNARTTGIDIVFENGIESTGTISCNYDFTVTEGNGLSETCSGSNGDYYTHPAFTFGDDELFGIWMGKFEISSETPTATNGGGNNTTLTVRVKPDVLSWRGNPVTNVYKVIYDMQKVNNIYGLSTDKAMADNHLMKNMEWAATAYLTNSKYGRCSNNSCTEVTMNSDSSYTTGGSDYVTNVNQSTTGNIYGIYDMNGGSWEYTMSNASGASGSYTYNASNGGSNFTYNASTTAKYVNTYAYGTSTNDLAAYNRSRLGDATEEVVLTAGSAGSWYGDLSNFVSSTTCQWFGRGGYINNNSGAGVFNFSCADGSGGSVHSARAALVALQ